MTEEEKIAQLARLNPSDPESKRLDLIAEIDEVLATHKRWLTQMGIDDPLISAEGMASDILLP